MDNATLRIGAALLAILLVAGSPAVTAQQPGLSTEDVSRIRTEVTAAVDRHTASSPSGT